jgi:hypothetical protein
VLNNHLIVTTKRKIYKAFLRIITMISKKMLVPLLATTLVLATGCKKIVREISEVLHEDATVIERIYSPSRHDLGVGVTALKVGDSFGVDYGGDFGLNIGHGLQVSASEVPENYGVLFRCKHGCFTSQGSDDRHKRLYNRLQTNQLVDVTYKEIYRTTYEDIEGSKEHKVTQRVLTGFDFLEAIPKTDSQISINELNVEKPAETK